MRIAALALALVCLPLVAFGGEDEFHLANGGKLFGEWLNRDQSPRSNYVIKTAHGQVTLPAQTVRRVVERSRDIANYDKFAAQLNDTIADHWNAAEKCRALGLVPQREHHLMQILRHDPNHKQARASLGFTKQRGRWVNTDQWRREQGLVLHGGSWRVRQDIENELLQKQRGQLEKDWKRKMRTWRQSALRGGRRSGAALANLKAVRHSRAVPGLSELLAEKGEKRDLKLIYIEVLSQIGGAGAANAMIKAYLEDRDELVRERALDVLARWKSKRAVAFFIKQLSSKNNALINRAGRGLGAIGDTSAVPELINALVTKHKFQIGSGGAGQINAAFGGGGNSGMGGLGISGRPKIVERDIPNRSVLDALLTITKENVNFEFNETAWKNWYVDRNTPAQVDLRRIK